MSSVQQKKEKTRNFVTSKRISETKSSSPKIHKEIDKYISDENRLPKTLQKGAILHGIVVKSQKGEILVDVGAKSEGIISGRELKSDHIDVNAITKGEEILVYVVNPEDENGQLILSIRRTGQARRWLQLQEAKEKDDIVEVEVLESNSGGLIVSLGEGIRGFIPTSQLDASRIYTNGQKLADKDITFNTQEKLSSLIGQKIKVRIIEIDRSKKVKILALLEEFSGWGKEGDGGDLTFMYENDPYIEKIAVVAEDKWKDQILMFLGAGRRQAEVKFFFEDEEQNARDWLNE